uniref:Lysine exporter LysO family protein n=1 Tax=Candidatus Aschnera chinzeii TaxID=1485666 RepID=A0AAT9G494_9ENTR|nr:MAG: lysine exporter LysO family protein [Candidatus Aschnera chinzeii]
MYIELLIVLASFTIGYIINCKTINIKYIYLLLDILLYIILFIMGIKLSMIDNLNYKLIVIFNDGMICFFCIFFSNIIFLICYDIISSWKLFTKNNNHTSHKFHTIIIKICFLYFASIIGYIVGLTKWWLLYHVQQTSILFLSCLLLLIGIVLNKHKLKINHFFINIRAVVIAIIVSISSLLGGFIASWILKLPANIGLAISAGYGWYSLSSVLLADKYGPLIGTIALFNDLMRELSSIILIPFIIYRFPSTALGICGSTSMDVTLSILHKSSNSTIIPFAIIHGIILTFCAPILITFFIYHIK